MIYVVDSYKLKILLLISLVRSTAMLFGEGLVNLIVAIQNFRHLK